MALVSVLRSHVSVWLGSGRSLDIPSPTMALARACARSAEESVDLLQDCWLDGSFTTFDHILTQYLFSRAIALFMSSLLGRPEIGSSNAQVRLDSACELLLELSQSGHLAAIEWHRQIEAIKSAMLGLRRRREELVETSSPAWRLVNEAGIGARGETTAGTASSLDMFGQGADSGFSLDLQCIDDLFSEDVSQGLYWPSFEHGDA
jgi:hypothetical protein